MKIRLAKDPLGGSNMGRTLSHCLLLALMASAAGHVRAGQFLLGAHTNYRSSHSPERLLARPEGLEPPAYWFEASRSIQLSYGRALRSL
jgi:hypothetical protein